MKSQSILYNIDYLTDRPTLYVFGQDKFYTKGGIFVSLIVIITSICFGVIFINDFSHKKNVNIVYYKEIPEQFLSFNLSDSIFMFKVSNNGIPDYYGHFVKTRVMLEHKIGNITTVRQLQVEKCEKYKNIPTKFNNLFGQSLLKDYFCLSSGQNVTMIYDPVTHEQNRIIVYVYPCDIEESSECASREEIENYFDESDIKITFRLERNRIDHYNNTNPFGSISFIEEKNIQFGMGFIEYIYWVMENYTSDDGMIFESKKYYNAISCDESGESSQFQRINFNQFAAKLYFGIKLSHVERYYRSYTKLQSVLADIASVMTVLKILGQIIINFIIETLFFTRVTFSVFEDKTIYKRNKFDDKGAKLSNNSNSILTTPSIEIPLTKKMELKSDNKNDKIFLFDRNALAKETTNIIKPNPKIFRDEN